MDENLFFMIATTKNSEDHKRFETSKNCSSLSLLFTSYVETNYFSGSLNGLLKLV